MSPATSPTSASHSANARVAWVDTAKGLGIILVVFGHVWRGSVSALHTPEAVFRPVDAFVYSFHMPLFFFLSGLFLPQAAHRTPGRFVGAKLRTIAYPYVVWYVIQGCFGVLLAGETNIAESPAGLVRRFAGGGYAQFWFLHTLFFGSLLYFAGRRLAGRDGTVLAGSVVLYFLAPAIAGAGWFSAASIAANFVYLAAGATAARLALRPPPVNPWVPLAVAVAAFAALVAVAAFRRAGPVPAVALLLALTGVAGSVAVAMVLSRSAGADWVRFLGTVSLPIYLAHILAAAGTRLLLCDVLHVRSLWANVAAGTAVGLAAPALLAVAASRLDFDVLFTLPPWAGRPSADPAPAAHTVNAGLT